MINVNFANRLSVTAFLEKIQNAKHRKIEFFTYVDSNPEDATATVEFDVNDEFNINDIFKHYLDAKNYSELTKTQLTDKFNVTLAKIKELDKYA